MPLGLSLDQVLLLATGGLLEVCVLLLLALVVARARARGAAARRRELREQGPPVVVGVVVDHRA
ncbi:hypothetical protein FHN55_01070 [Streptomyces sp. NP160]|uniref:hypothetical protein n=1 Tax=Streptomyces sp. NP160 TaxID=2586637 RepID=UPI00111B6118|nr:hypothetical protein [Streptomyces sp. NP160]TNM70302.1 hypothetical protein FHN55_01070 [Streptomyces sp. NP160]